jgi:hypothetical protein
MKFIYRQLYVIFNRKLTGQPSIIHNSFLHKITLSIVVILCSVLPQKVLSGTITTGTISGSPFCAGETIIVPFTYTGVYTTFTAQLSNPIGSFTSGTTNLQSVSSNGSGSQSITVTIPGSAIAGIVYKIRVTSNLPPVVGSPSASFAITPNKWLGISTDWNSASNWCNGIVPDASTSVIIQTASNYPVITGTDYVNGITINTGASITIGTGGILSIHGALSNSGTFDVTAGTLEMSGAVPQSIDGSQFVSSTIYNLIDSNTEQTAFTGLTILNNPINITGQLKFGIDADAILTTNGLLVLVSNDSATASVGEIQEDGFGGPEAFIEGNVTVQRYFPAHRRWRLVAAPVHTSGAPTISAAWQEGGQSIAGSVSNPNPGFGTHISGPAAGAFVSSSGYDQSSNSSPSIAMLTAANAWFAIPNTFVPVTTYQGYMLFVRGDRSFPIFTGTSSTLATTTTLRTTGTINTGMVTVPVNSGFTVVGNPYPATINFNNVYASSASALTSNSFSVWDPNIGSAANVATGTGGWVTLSWNGTSYDASPDPTVFDGFDTNGDIQSGAAFAVDGTSGSVQMDESDKVIGTDNHLYLFRSANTAPLSKLHTTLYSTDIANAYLADGALNEFSTDYTDDLNYNKDVKKLFSFNETIAVLKSGQNLSIQKTAPPVAGDTIHLAVTSLKQSSYKLVVQTSSFVRPDLKAFLIDSYTNTSTPILLGDTATTINFTVTSAPASYAAARFSIVFAAAPGSVTYTAVTATQENKNIAVEWAVDNQLNINKYVVEKSTDGVNFYPVDTTMATTASASTYDWLDVTAVIGDNYYRIRSIDNTGAISYSKPVDVVMGKGIIAGIQIYPNPVTDGTVALQMNNVPAGEYGIKIMSASGQVILTETIEHGASSETYPIPLNKQLADGIYILEVIHPDKTITKINFENQ